MSGQSLPHYTHIPGVTPHPIRDPAGHSYLGPGCTPQIRKGERQPPLTGAELATHSEFLWAVHLFNAGYYWEAHEAWEELWHAAGRRGDLADFLKGLIKLAAAGVKLREHNRVGVERHAKRAWELFTAIQSETGSSPNEDTIPMVLSPFIEIAERLITQPPPFPEDRCGQPVAALPQLPSRNCSSTT